MVTRNHFFLFNDDSQCFFNRPTNISAQLYLRLYRLTESGISFLWDFLIDIDLGPMALRFTFPESDDKIQINMSRNEKLLMNVYGILV